MNKTFISLSLLIIAMLFVSCGTGANIRGANESNVSVNIADGATDVPVDQSFTLDFGAPLNASTVTTNTLFIMPATPASASVVSRNLIQKSGLFSSTKAASATCDPLLAVDASVTVSGSSADIIPDPLENNTGYCLCATASIGFNNPDQNGFFSGLTRCFTTEASGTTFSVGGTISGLSAGDTAVLQNNTGDDLTLTTDGTFTFTTEIADGATYAVTVLTQPFGKTCSISNSTGTISGAAVTDVSVVCSADTYTVGGTVSGLVGTVVLQNNAANNLILTSDGLFTFTTAVADGAGYAVTVLTQPAGQACVVSNGTGTISGAIVEDVAVVCTDTTYTVGGTVSGLVGTVVLQNNAGDDLSVSANGEFAFTTKLADTTHYVVTVFTQPDDVNCLITNGTGDISGVDVEDVDVTCYEVYTGDVTISDAATLVTAQGYGRIIGNLTIDPACNVAVSLPYLVEVTGYVDAESNEDAGFTAFAAPLLSTVGGNFTISFDTKLLTLTFTGLESVAGEFYISSPSLTTVTFTNLETVTGKLTVSSNSVLTNISFENLGTLVGSLSISSNDFLETVALPDLTTVGGDISVSSNSALTDISFAGLETLVGSFTISDNVILDTITLPVTLTSVGGLYISGNSALSSLAAFDNITDVTGTLSIGSSDSLTAVSLGNLTTLAGSLEVYENAFLETLSFASVSSVGGGVSINNNDSLTETTFTLLGSIVSTLNISGNTALTSAEFPALTTISSGYLYIDGNTACTATTFGDPMLPLLVNVGKTNTDTVTLTGNTGLTDAVAKALATQLTSEGWLGESIISGNDPL